MPPALSSWPGPSYWQQRCWCHPRRRVSRRTVTAPGIKAVTAGDVMEFQTLPTLKLVQTVAVNLGEVWAGYAAFMAKSLHASMTPAGEVRAKFTIGGTMKRLDLAGDQEAANRLIAAPPPAPVVRAAPVFVPPPPRLALEVKGQTFGETWGDYEVADASRIPREYWLLDDKKIRGVIRTMKASTNIPGIRVSDPRPKTTVRQTA
mgnify:CR=1 FL=1